MKSGIYLGPPVGRARALVRVLVVVGVVGTLFHLGFYWRQANELSALRDDLERRRVQEASAPAALDDDARAVIARLHAASESGAATTMTPTELLQMVGDALPDEVALVGLSLEPSEPRPSLLVDAIARREEDVTALERGIAASERVAATKLLGERSAADGSLSVRLQVDLNP